MTANTRCANRTCSVLEPSGPLGYCDLCYQLAVIGGYWCWNHGQYPMAYLTWDDDRGVRRTSIITQPCPWCCRQHQIPLYLGACVGCMVDAVLAEAA